MFEICLVYSMRQRVDLDRSDRQVICGEGGRRVYNGEVTDSSRTAFYLRPYPPTTASSIEYHSATLEPYIRTLTNGSSWHHMSNPTYLNLSKPISSPCPTNGRQTVGDGAFYVDAAPSVLAVCHLQGADDMYYYSTTFSGGPGWRF